MNMHINDELLYAYLDGELDDAQREQIERARAADPVLDAKLVAWGVQDTTLRTALDAELDEALPQAWLEMVREPAPPSVPARPSWMERLMRWMPAPRFAAGLALAVLVGIFVGKEVIPHLDMDGQLVRLASVAHHVYSPDKRQPVEVKSTDPTLTSWISKRLGAKVVAPSIGKFRFLGGRLLAGAEEPAGQFMYENAAGKRFTVFVRTEGAKDRSDGPECSSYRGVGVCYWFAGDVVYALAGEVPQAELAALAGPAAASVRAARP